MNIKEWLNLYPTNFIHFEVNDKLEDILETVIANPQQSDFYVLDNENVVIGYIPLNKITSVILASHHPVQTHREILDRITIDTAQDLMTKHFSYCRENEDVDSVLHRFTEHNLRILPVLDEHNHLIAYIDLQSVLKAAKESVF